MQNLFGEEVDPRKKPHIDTVKRNWEDRFQRWCNREINDESTHYGICVNGSMCYYCDGDTFGKPCVRALNELLRTKKLKIDYSTATFEDVWNGKFGE